MGTIPQRVAERLVAGVKRFQSVLSTAKARDVNEADTTLIIVDILSTVFGYDRYTEITAEQLIRGTYCDLAIKIDGKIHLLLEIKAVGLDLKGSHVKQAIDYAANQGIEWVVLTTGVLWRVFRVVFAKPIDQELVLDFDFLSLSPRSPQNLEDLYLLTREGLLKSVLPEYYAQRQATNRFLLAAILLGDPVLEAIRREVRKLYPGVRINAQEIGVALAQDVLKREVVEGEKATEARKKVQRSIAKTERIKAAKASEGAPHTQEAHGDGMGVGDG